MKKRCIAPLAAVAVAGVAVAASGHVAWAHHPTVTATAICDATGSPVIEFTSTSWDGGSDGEHPRIEILFDGAVVDTGAYVEATGNTFSGSAPADALPGEVVAVGALASGPWANGTDGGQLAEVHVTIPDDCVPDVSTGRFTGGGHQLRVDAARVTRGLTVHCDLLLSNNLEVNWGGNQFHMTEHLQTVECSDDPEIIQAPPPAPLDTLVGVGTGRYNGRDGYTIHFTLVDHGEPGSSDEAALRIFETAQPANVVLDVPLQELSGGNLQAHYDQPHR